MKLPQLIEETIRYAMLESLDDIRLTCRRIERDLQVFGSELSPYFHELNAQLDQLCERIEGHKFGNQGNQDKAGGQEPPAPPAE